MSTLVPMSSIQLKSHEDMFDIAASIFGIWKYHGKTSSILIRLTTSLCHIKFQISHIYIYIVIYIARGGEEW